MRKAGTGYKEEEQEQEISSRRRRRSNRRLGGVEGARAGDKDKEQGGGAGDKVELSQAQYKKNSSTAGWQE